MNNGNIFQQLIAATFPVGGYEMHWLELIGILIGAASAYLGMKRWVWAWPVGILANVMLFFVYLGALFGADERIPLFGQAGRLSGQVANAIAAARRGWRFAWTICRSTAKRFRFSPPRGCRARHHGSSTLKKSRAKWPSWWRGCFAACERRIQPASAM